MPAGGPGSILKNLALKAASLGLERGCRLVVTVVAAPVLGEAAFGRFVFATTVTAVLALAADLGLGIWTTRALARGGADRPSIVRLGLTLRGFAAVPYGVVVAAVAVLAEGAETRVAVALLGVAAACNAFADHVGAILRGTERFADEARQNAARAALIAALGLGALAFGRSLASLCLAMAAASVGGLAYGLYGVLRVYPRAVAATIDRTLARVALREATPIWVAGLLSLLYFKVDTLFVRSLSGDAELGAYGAAYKLFEGAMLLPAVVLAVAFPRLVRAHADQVSAARSLERRIALTLLGIGLAVGAVFLLARGPLIETVFGATFRRSEDSLRVLAFGVPLVYVNFGLTHFLVARGRERVNTALAFMMLVAVVALDLTLIPSGSGPGAALATVLAEVLLGVGCLIALGLDRPERSAPRPAPAASSASRTSA